MNCKKCGQFIHPLEPSVTFKTPGSHDQYWYFHHRWEGDCWSQYQTQEVQ